MGSLSSTIVSGLLRHFFAEFVRNQQLVTNPEYVTTRPTSELTCGPGVCRLCTGRGEQAEPVLVLSETLSLFYIVWYWHGRGLERGGDRWSVYRRLFYADDVDRRYSRVAEEGKESYQTINGVNQEESELSFTFLHGFESSDPLLSFGCSATWACCV